VSGPRRQACRLPEPIASQGLPLRDLPPVFPGTAGPRPQLMALSISPMPCEHARRIRPGGTAGSRRLFGARWPLEQVIRDEASWTKELAGAAMQGSTVTYREGSPRQGARAKAVLEICRKKEAGVESLTQRAGRGVSPVRLRVLYGQVAEVEGRLDERLRVRRVVCCVDCGTVINPIHPSAG